MSQPKRFHQTRKSPEAEIKRIQAIDCTWSGLGIYKVRSKTSKNRFWIGTYMEWLNR